MADKILLNNQEFFPSTNDLPCLITYGEKVGGSHFSVTFLVDLFLQGKKILMLTAYPAAKDNFLEQTNNSHDQIDYLVDINNLKPNKQAIILESGNEKLFKEAIEKLTDLDERIVMIKNMEVFSKETIELGLKLKNIILSGNIDTCAANKEIISSDLKTIITFSKPDTPLPIEIPDLEKYTGYLWNKYYSGLTTIKKLSV